MQLTHRAISFILALAIALAPAAIAAAATTHTSNLPQTNTLSDCPCAQQQSQPNVQPPHCPLCITAQTTCKGDPERWCTCNDDCRCAALNPAPPAPNPHNTPATPPSPRTNIPATYPTSLINILTTLTPAQVTRSIPLPADSRRTIPTLGLNNTRPQATACRWLT